MDAVQEPLPEAHFRGPDKVFKVQSIRAPEPYVLHGVCETNGQRAVIADTSNLVQPVHSFASALEVLYLIEHSIRTEYGVQLFGARRNPF